MSRSCHSGNVLEPDERRRAHDAREPADPLRHLRVALVRHRGRALLPGRERLLDLAHLGAREVADLGREAVERRRRERERRSSSAWRSRAITCVETGSGSSPSRSQATRSTSGLDRRVRADRARELSDAEASSARTRRVRSRSSSNAQPASFQPKRRRLGVDAVRAADAASSDAPRPAARPRRARGRPRDDEPPASRICSDSAVSTTSEEVRP